MRAIALVIPLLICASFVAVFAAIRISVFVDSHRVMAARLVSFALWIFPGADALWTIYTGDSASRGTWWRNAWLPMGVLFAVTIASDMQNGQLQSEDSIADENERSEHLTNGIYLLNGDTIVTPTCNNLVRGLTR